MLLLQQWEFFFSASLLALAMAAGIMVFCHLSNPFFKQLEGISST